MEGEDSIATLRQGNAEYAAAFDAGGLSAPAQQRVLVLTCMDSRIVPHAIFGLGEGDMKVIRNAGGQLNPEVERDIVLASYLLDCETVVIMPHTQCAMTSMTVADIQNTLAELSGLDFSSFTPRMVENQEEKLRADVAALQANALLREGTTVRGAIYEVGSGEVRWVC